MLILSVYALQRVVIWCYVLKGNYGCKSNPVFLLAKEYFQRDTLYEATVALRTVVITFVTWLISRTEFLV